MVVIHLFYGKATPPLPNNEYTSPDHSLPWGKNSGNGFREGKLRGNDEVFPQNSVSRVFFPSSKRSKMLDHRPQNQHGPRDLVEGLCLCAACIVPFSCP